MSVFNRKCGGSKPSHKGPALRPSIFDGLSDKEISITYNAVCTRKFKRDDLVVKQGETGRSIYVILEGSVRITMRSGDTSKNIDTLTKGQVIGELAFIRKKPRGADVVVLEPSRMMEITEEAFESLPLKIQLTVYKNLAGLAADRIEKFRRQSAGVVEERERLYDYILKTGDKTSDVISSAMIQEMLKKIPKLPMYATELTAKLVDDNTTPHEVADSIRLDPSLAALILKIVNSSFFNFPNKISDLNRAVVIMGFNNVYQLVVNAGIKSVMPSTEQFNNLQARSYMTSMIAYEISMRSDKQKAGVNSTIGLLGYLGESLKLLLKQKNHKISELIDSMDHPTLGAALLGNWGLPERLCKIVERQHYPEFSPPDRIPADCRQELGVFYVSKILLSLLMDGKQIEYPTTYFHDYAVMLRLPQSTPEELLKQTVAPALMKNENRIPEELRYEIRRSDWLN